MITGGMCTSFKKECLQGTHAFGTDTLKIALYTSSATLGPSTTAYSSTNEVAGGAGYTQGGAAVTNVTVTEDGASAVVGFDDVVWSSASFTARAGLIYNASKSNRAIGVVDFGSDRTGSGGTFTLVIPPALANQAVIRFD